MPGKLIMMVGVPGAGKTTVAQKVVAKGFHYLNADKIRAELYGSEAEQGDKEQVFKIFFERLEAAMQENLSIIIDNTNLNPRQREPILAMAKKHGYVDIQLWYLDVPLDLCLSRNKNRERVVPDEIVTNMYHELNKNGRPKRSEGKIVIIKPSKDGEDYLFFPQG
ncbi:MAG: AAA family ATPase [Cyanobacteria bacterium SZAS LIN-3]|nr:AAA family ATPase [Cyanobacteria bacterium SZAS LIN-3]